MWQNANTIPQEIQKCTFPLRSSLHPVSSLFIIARFVDNGARKMKYHSVIRHGACLLFWLGRHWWMLDAGLVMNVCMSSFLWSVGWLVNVNEILVGHMTCCTNVGKYMYFIVYKRLWLLFFGEHQFIFSTPLAHTHTNRYFHIFLRDCDGIFFVALTKMRSSRFSGSYIKCTIRTIPTHTHTLLRLLCNGLKI